ncbi:hypothetical protein GOBAR_AA03670 [Gossypium barbadense]|uniref:Uncharacterized protein n=1 Tax=Gossypium barbadense TaxID=3634 RepID=A0A2P5YMT5_GOSBA|nr:hypothetical protein GOBAR_AA03670 [Gossypium barbadense]
MSSSRGKKAAVPASKERKGASSSSGPTAEICHSFLSLISPRQLVHQPRVPEFDALVPDGAIYNPSRSKASALPPSLRYLHTILAHTITGWMIEKRPGTYPHQYCLAQSTKEEAYEDIPDDVPPQHEDPPNQPPPPSRLVHVAASYTDISERLTRFEQ